MRKTFINYVFLNSVSQGSVVVGLYIDTQSSTADALKAYLKEAGSFGEYKLVKASSLVDKVTVGMYITLTGS